jgi:hypothetical protein
MSKRLLEVLRNYRIVQSKAALAEWAEAVNKTPITIERWLKRGRIPSADDAFKLAMVVVRDKDEALALVKDEPLHVKESA